jgi:hypothetical protein
MVVRALLIQRKQRDKGARETKAAVGDALLVALGDALWVALEAAPVWVAAEDALVVVVGDSLRVALEAVLVGSAVDVVGFRYILLLG